MPAPFLAAEPPAAWVAADVARPPLAESSGAEWVSWNAWSAPEKEGTLVAGCFAAAVPGWVEDMRPAFSGRVVSIAGATGAQIAGFGVETFPVAEGARDSLGLRATGGGTTVGYTKTFLGFGGTNAYSCFVVCAAPNAAPPACNEVVVQTRLVDGDAPPEPGLALQAVTWAVHHPSTTATGFAVVTLVGAMLAIATRRKPRARG
jgi:hypothetical protein